MILLVFSLVCLAAMVIFVAYALVSDYKRKKAKWLEDEFQTLCADIKSCKSLEDLSLVKARANKFNARRLPANRYSLHIAQEFLLRRVELLKKEEIDVKPYKDDKGATIGMSY